MPQLFNFITVEVNEDQDGSWKVMQQVMSI